MAVWGRAGWVMLAGAAVVVVKIATSAPQLLGQTAMVAITWLVTIAFVVVGVALLATEVPPANGVACVLVAAATIPGDFNDPYYTGSVLAAIGFVLEPLYLVAAVALVLRYPKERLSAPERRLVIALLTIGVLSRLGTAFTDGQMPDGFYRPTDWSVPSVPAALHDEVFVQVGRASTAVVLVVVAVILARRLGLAKGLSRQSQAPLVVIGLLCAFAAAVDQLIWAAGVPELRSLPAALARNLTAAILPAAIIADLLRRRAAGAAVSNRVLSASLSGSPARLQKAVRAVFADPTAAVEIPDGTGGWLAADGGTTRPPPPGASRRIQGVSLGDGEDVLRLSLDSRAVQDEGLLSSVVDAIRVGAHNTRLNAELLAAMAELRRSRERIVQESLAQRRRMERDLHDGAQQQFLAVAATLAQTDLVEDERVREVVRTARATLGDALAQLRDLARGIHPSVLSQGGLAPAVLQLCERAPWPVKVTIDPECATLSDTAAAACYFVVAELLTNAARHAHASHVIVDVRVDEQQVSVAVNDDGVGGAQLVAGGGLAGLRDRVQALGGDLVVQDGQVGEPGSTITATIPVTGGTSA